VTATADDRRPLAVLAIATAVVVLLLWVLTPVGLVAALVLLVLAPPWGRSLTERAVVSALVLLGVVAIAFPRAGSMPVTVTSARLFLSLFLVAVLALRLVPALRRVTIPRPTLADLLAALLGVASAAWLMWAYVGRSAVEIVSGLFFSGWDNEGHFTTFANTYESGSTTWPTLDGSVAWNQWYPSLHSTVWSLAELLFRPVAPLMDRPGLLWPYVQWSALTFAFCLVALAWVAGDVAARLAGRERARWARPLAVGVFAVFALLGSPALLFNAGFTNFMMAVTVVVTGAWIAGRSLTSARRLGWFLVPLCGLSVIGLWTPLVLGLVPSGIVVAIALLAYRRWLGIAWLLATVAVAAYMALTQMSAILGVEPGQSTGDFAADLGSVGTGMVPFNLGLALLSPVIAVLLAVLLVRAGRWPMAVAVVGPILGAAIVAVVFARGADQADLGRLQSYYVLKPLDAMLLAVATLVAALLAVAVARAVVGLPRGSGGISVALTVVIVLGTFGYAGALPEQFSAGFTAAPGIQAGADRMRGINDPLIGEAIIRAQQAAVPYPDRTTLLWDGAGTLPNLWVSALHGVMSKSDNRFYRDLPAFPYDDRTLSYVDLALNLNPSLRLAALWFRPSSGDLLGPYAATSDGRVASVEVPMPPNLLCPECSP
jgi:hypothetical protein